MDAITSTFLRTAVNLAEDICRERGVDFISITREGIVYAVPVEGSELVSHGWIPWIEDRTDTNKTNGGK